MNNDTPIQDIWGFIQWLAVLVFGLLGIGLTATLLVVCFSWFRDWLEDSLTANTEKRRQKRQKLVEKDCL